MTARFYKSRRSPQRAAFTLIELMAVIAIIALLIGILIPSLNGAQKAVKKAQTKATFAALSTAIESFKAESTIGGMFPPSASDNQNDKFKIFSPLGTSIASGDLIEVNGAQLLVFALYGADLLGTPGFPDSIHTDLTNPGWWDDMTARYDTSNSIVGAYAKDNYIPVKPRFGPFVDEKAPVSTVNKLEIAASTGAMSGDTADLPVFLDAWGQPILYYKARPAAKIIITQFDSNDNITTPGIYDWRDNILFTGTEEVSDGTSGIQFGAGAHTALDSPAEFADFIADHQKTLGDSTDPDNRRLIPHNSKTYLLISAGPDMKYGTADDITNWESND